MRPRRPRWPPLPLARRRPKEQVMTDAIVADVPELAVGPPRRVRWNDTLLRVGVMVIVILAAEFAARRADSPFFPPPSKVWDWAREHWFDGPAWRLWIGDDLIEAVRPSLKRLALGYAF